MFKEKKIVIIGSIMVVSIIGIILLFYKSNKSNSQYFTFELNKKNYENYLLHEPILQ